MRLKANETKWCRMYIRGVEGYFCDFRIERDSIPEGFHFWELADGDSDGTPCRYRPGILVNFYGTFITKGDLPVDEPDSVSGWINNEEEWGFSDGYYEELSDMIIEEGLKEVGNAPSLEGL